MSDPNKYWFPAKKYGWGWGVPVVWQGRIVLGAFFCLVGAGAFALLPGRGPAMFVAYCVVLCLALVLVCWIKGEPPRWRRGKK